MKRIVRQSAAFVVLLALLTIVRFPYSEYIEEKILIVQQKLRPQGVTLQTGKVKSSFPFKLSIDTLGVLFLTKPFPIPLLADHAVLELRTLPLLMLRAALAVNLSMYSGKVSGDLTKGLFSKIANLELHGSKLQIGKYPLASALTADGILDFDVSAQMKLPQAEKNLSARSLAQLISTGTAELKIEEGLVAGGQKIYGLFTLPRIEGITGQAKARKSRERLQVERAKFYSSLGTAEGTGNVYFDPEGQIDQASINGTIALTTPGVTAIGSYLALAAGTSTEKPGRNWSVQLEKKSGKKVELKLKSSD